MLATRRIALERQIRRGGTLRSACTGIHFTNRGPPEMENDAAGGGIGRVRSDGLGSSKGELLQIDGDLGLAT